MILPVHFTLGSFSNTRECFSLMPDGEDTQRQLVIQGEQIRAPLSSKYLAKDLDVFPSGRHEFQYTCETRSLLKQLRTFFFDNLGRGKTFWFPTWEFDLKGSPSINPTGIYLWDGGYLSTYYNLGPAFRHVLAVGAIRYGSFLLHSMVQDSPITGWDAFQLLGTGNNGGDPAQPWTEALGIRVLWLRYGRFDTDSFSVESLKDGGGIVRLALVEESDEAPLGA